MGEPRSYSKRQLFRHIGYEPHAGQIEVHRSQARFRILACGSRWGKSVCAAMEVVAALLSPCERSLGWVVAPTSELTGRVLDPVRSVLHQHFKHRIVEDDPGTQRIVVRNFGGGLSDLRGKTADNPVSLLGEAVDWLVIDEAAKLKSAIWESHLSQRLIDRRGWALLISTPRGRGYFYTLFRRGQRRRDPAYHSWSAPSWQNPHVDRETIEEERKRLPPEVFQQEYEGRFLGVHAEPCERCGGPDPDVSGVLVLHEGQELLHCEDCGKGVDASGHTLVKRWPDGRTMLELVILSRNLESPPPLPAAPVPPS